MSMVERMISVPAEHEKNVFGQFDQFIKKIEKSLNVTVISRDGTTKILGSEPAADHGPGLLAAALCPLER